MDITNVRRSFHEYMAVTGDVEALEYRAWKLIIQEWTWRQAVASFVTHASIADIVAFAALLGGWTAWCLDRWLTCKPIRLLGD